MRGCHCVSPSILKRPLDLLAHTGIKTPYHLNEGNARGECHFFGCYISILWTLFGKFLTA